MLTDALRALFNNPFKEKFYETQKKKKKQQHQQQQQRIFNLSSKLRKSRYGWNSQPNAVKYPSLVKANQFR